MLTMTYAQLRDHSFFQAIQKLAHATTIKNPRVLLNASKIHTQCMKAWKDSDEKVKALLDKYGKKGDDGQLVTVDPDGRGTVLDPETAAEYHEKDAEFMATVIEFDRPKIALEDLAEVGLSPLEVTALMPFLEYTEA